MQTKSKSKPAGHLTGKLVIIPELGLLLSVVHPSRRLSVVETHLCRPPFAALAMASARHGEASSQTRARLLHQEVSYL